MKKAVFSILLLFFSLTLTAQYYTETIYLKNGGVIKGTIIEQIPDESVKIVTFSDDIMIFRFDEISKITRQKVKSYINRNSRTNGYRGLIDIGYSFGISDIKKTDRVEISLSQGYAFNSNFYIGAGVAVNYYTQGDGMNSAWAYPIFINPRVYLTDGMQIVSPFLDLKIGYTTGSSVKGFYLNPSIGTNFSLNNGNIVNISVGYTWQSTDVMYWGSWSSSIEKKNLGALSLKVGVEF